MTVPTSSLTLQGPTTSRPLCSATPASRSLVLPFATPRALPPGQPLISLHCAPPRPSPPPLLFLTPQDHHPTRLPHLDPRLFPVPSSHFSSGPGPPPNSHHRWASPSSPSTTFSRLALLGSPPAFHSHSSSSNSPPSISTPGLTLFSPQPLFLEHDCNRPVALADGLHGPLEIRR